MSSICLYFGLFLVESCLGFLLDSRVNKKHNNGLIFYQKNGNSYLNLVNVIILFFMILIPSIIAGMRYMVGRDYDTYILIYNAISKLNKYKSEILPKFTIEIGSFYLFKLSEIMFSDFRGFFFLSALITYSIVIKNMTNYVKKESMGMMLLIFFSIYIGPSYNIVRQILAASIVFSSFKHIEERNFMKFVITIIFATLFHSSSILCIVLYFINIKKDETKYNMNNRRFYLLLGLLMLILLGFGPIYTFLVNNIPFLFKYSAYKLQKFEFNSGIFIARLPILIMIIYFKNKLVKYNTINYFYILLYFFEIFGVLISSYTHWGLRLIYFFMFSEVILIPQIIRLQKNKNSKLLVELFIWGYYISYFLIIHFYYENDGIFPYQILK